MVRKRKSKTNEWLVAEDREMAARMVFLSGGVFTARASQYLATVGNLRIDKPFDSASLLTLIAKLVAAAQRAVPPLGLP